MAGGRATESGQRRTFTMMVLCGLFALTIVPL
jgi:hypothetical protein